MASGMAYLQLASVMLVIWSSLFVWWTRHEVIFPQRSAPKFIFDVSLALVIIPF